MSGFEVAGIVLGSIPVIVASLKYYKKGASAVENFRSYRRLLDDLIRVLKAEHAILQEVWEKLLIGIVPTANIEKMIYYPFGSLWKDGEYYLKLKQRLWRSFEVFEYTVLDMQEAIIEMMTKLDIGPDGKIRTTEGISFKRHFKRAAFILQKPNHKECMIRICDGVSSLQKLARLSIEMDPKRKLRSQGKVNQSVRDISGSIYQALRSAMSCCPSAHSMGLGLTPPLRTIGPEDEADAVVGRLEFRLFITCQLLDPEEQWREMVMQILEEAKSDVSVQTQQKRVIFSLTREVSMTDPGQSSVNNTSAAKQIESLCYAMQGELKDCGCIIDSKSARRRQFRVQALGSLVGDWKLMPIKDVLTPEKICSVSYGERFRLARNIACGVLQTCGTQWLSCSPTHDNIYLMNIQGVPNYQHAFVITDLPEPNQATSVASDPVLLSLGILLIELILGQTMDNVQVAPANDNLALLISKYEAAARLLGRVNMVGGSGYYSAVQYCLRCYVQGRDFTGNSEMLAEIFAGIIGPLEEDLVSIERESLICAVGDQGKGQHGGKKARRK